MRTVLTIAKKQMTSKTLNKSKREERESLQIKLKIALKLPQRTKALQRRRLLLSVLLK
jgi:hypothetical protein